MVGWLEVLEVLEEVVIEEERVLGKEGGVGKGARSRDREAQTLSEKISIARYVLQVATEGMNYSMPDITVHLLSILKCSGRLLSSPIGGPLN